MAPLWIVYEVLRFLMTPLERNGAEDLIHQGLLWLGPLFPWAPRALVGLAVLSAAWSLSRRDVPWARVGMVNALEGTLCGLVLGPLSALLAERSVRLLEILPVQTLQSGSLAHDLVASLGAGIFEEFFFRFGLLTLLVLIFARVGDVFAAPRPLAVAAAILASGFVFALFHHIGPGAPKIENPVLLFRTAAGVLLGALFVARGIGVCIWAHSAYDVHYFLTHHHA